MVPMWTFNHGPWQLLVLGDPDLLYALSFQRGQSFWVVRSPFGELELLYSSGVQPFFWVATQLHVSYYYTGLVAGTMYSKHGVCRKSSLEPILECSKPQRRKNSRSVAEFCLGKWRFEWHEGLQPKLERNESIDLRASIAISFLPLSKIRIFDSPEIDCLCKDLRLAPATGWFLGRLIGCQEDAIFHVHQRVCALFGRPWPQGEVAR